MAPITDDPAAHGSISRLQGLQRLMPFRVREVLLVANRYDSFILEEEGKITDLILEEFDRLNLRYAPRLNSTPSVEEALSLIGSGRRFDLVIVTMHPDGMSPADFARAVRERAPRLPIVLLGYDNRDFQELLASPDAAAFDRSFLWTGDARILLAIVSSIEDERNVAHDTGTVGVEVIILIEDSIHFASSFLPLLYGNLMKQSQSLIGEGITVPHTVLRMRARPKVLLADSFETGWAHYERYRRFVLGVISDVRFRRDGVTDERAGLRFAERVRADNPDVPILLQSSHARNAELARGAGMAFVHKASPTLHHELREFMLDAFGFGPFVFRHPDGTEVTTAHDLREFRAALRSVPLDSFRYHAERRDFQVWLKARTEFGLAARLHPRTVTDDAEGEAMREHFIATLDEGRRDAHADAIGAFTPDEFGTISTFARIGGGSLGGKARGLAFLNLLLREQAVHEEFPGVEIAVPPTVVIGTEMFDAFVDTQGLADLARTGASDAEIRAAFLAAALPDDLAGPLRALAAIMDYPCAVRSSSLLEDSQHQPFAGVYETYMLPNREANAEVRYRDLAAAVKLVYASTFFEDARRYLDATPHRAQKEKMAVIIQKLIGRAHDGRFYPTFSGVAQSYNYYPVGRITPEDGAARVALGLGKTVVEGRGGLGFCPRYPRHLPQFSTVDDILRNAQKSFEALPLEEVSTNPHERFQPQAFAIDQASRDGTLAAVGSVYVPDRSTIYDGTGREGVPLVTFAEILKSDRFPLAGLLDRLLTISRDAMATPVEIEFAADLDRGDERPDTFACLQLRPLAVTRDLSRTDVASIPDEHLLCRSARALGHGRTRDLLDVVCVVPDEFDRRRSPETATDVAQLDATLRAEERPYVLIGPGRWGSADPWLGIPVKWGQIGAARIIVETGFSEITVTPSDGSHFFHNLTAFQVAYMTVNPQRGEGFIDWEWLLAQGTVRECANGLRWMRLAEPALGLIDGRTRSGAIVKSARQSPQDPQQRPEPDPEA